MFHLARRALSSFLNTPVGRESLTRAAAILLPREMELWSAMQPRDQRHSLVVLERFDALIPGASRPERAAALLHDVGKCTTDLGWAGRVIATLVGPRTARMATYLDHERIGAGLLGPVSDPLTVRLVGGTATGPVAEALRRADDV